MKKEKKKKMPVKEDNDILETCSLISSCCCIIIAITIIILIVNFIFIKFDDNEKLNDQEYLISEPIMKKDNTILYCSDMKPCNMTCSEYLEYTDENYTDCTVTYIVNIVIIIICVCALIRCVPFMKDLICPVIDMLCCKKEEVNHSKLEQDVENP